MLSLLAEGRGTRNLWMTNKPHNQQEGVPTTAENKFNMRCMEDLKQRHINHESTISYHELDNLDLVSMLELLHHMLSKPKRIAQQR